MLVLALVDNQLGGISHLRHMASCHSQMSDDQLEFDSRRDHIFGLISFISTSYSEFLVYFRRFFGAVPKTLNEAEKFKQLFYCIVILGRHNENNPANGI